MRVDSILRWPRREWDAFKASYDALELSLALSLRLLALQWLAFCVVMILQVVWAPLAGATRFEHAWLPVLLFTLCCLCSYTFHRLRGRGPWGPVLTVADTVLGLAAVTVVAVNTAVPATLVWGGIACLVIVSIHGRIFSLTWVFVLMCGVPTFGVALLFAAEPVLLVLFVAGLSTGFLMAHLTGRQRCLRRQNEALRLALDASEAMATKSMDIALASTLTNLGHFLHELRNSLMGMGLSLGYVQKTRQESEVCAAAIADAVEAYNRMQAWVEATVAGIRAQGVVEARSFALMPLLEALERDVRELQIVRQGAFPVCSITGDPESLTLVFRDMLRNAAQAGATTVWVSVALQPGPLVQVSVRDNGVGLPEPVLARLFEPFATYGKSSGTGLGLYLIKRRVELFGGQVTGGNAPQGGAVFTLLLPCAAGKLAEPG